MTNQNNCSLVRRRPDLGEAGRVTDKESMLMRVVPVLSRNPFKTMVLPLKLPCVRGR